MKKTFFLGLTIMVAISINSQENELIRIKFETPENKTVPVYKEIFIGEIETQGYDSEGFTFQTGTLTKRELLVNAPGVIYLDKGGNHILSIGENMNKLEFAINNQSENQNWYLRPAGINLQKGRNRIVLGIAGIVTSAFIFGGIAICNSSQMKTYQMDLDYYNNVKNMGTFFAQQIGDPPKKPEQQNLKYIVPALTMSFSIGWLISGRRIYDKNRPLVYQTEN